MYIPRGYNFDHPLLLPYVCAEDITQKLISRIYAYVAMSESPFTVNVVRSTSSVAHTSGMPGIIH